MFAWFQGLEPMGQAFLAGLFTWLITLMGAALFFMRREVPRLVLDFMMGFAAGVMIAASFWSLLSPGILVAEKQGEIPWLVATLGFLLGAGAMFCADKLVPHLHPGLSEHAPEGPPSTFKRSTLLFAAMTIHNIPEGLAVGVAFGAAAQEIPFSLGMGVSGALALSLGIGIQNFPEGLAVAMPLRRAGLSRFKSFLAGQFSALVEPVAAVLGAFMVMAVLPLLPWALCFAAGAMIYVVVEELLPEAQENGCYDLVTFAVISGFTVMMALDVALG